MKKCLSLLFAASSMLLFNACENEVFAPERVENTKDLAAPADFDWKTTQNQTYNLISKVNTVVSIYTDKSCTDESLLIENLVLNANEATEVSLNIPTYVTSIFVQYPTENGKDVFEINTNEVTTRAEASFIQLPAEKDIEAGIFLDWEYYYYPSRRGQGTLMFEDLYPSKGDYDFNDYVVGYNVEIFKSSFTGIEWVDAIVGFTMKFQIRAIGGSLPFRPAIRLKGFAMENLGGTKIECSSSNGVTIELLKEGRTGKDDVIFFINGTESLCNGGYYNTVAGQINKDLPVVTCKVTRPRLGLTSKDVRITKQYKALAQRLPDYFDFFIQNKETGDEIHFKGFSPTGIEGNKQSTDTEYNSNENLVWAIAVPQKLSHPAEKEDIIKAYPGFKDWVISGGKKNQNWYRHPKGSVIVLN